MSTERHTRASEIFLAVCDLDPRERTTQIERRCSDDPELRKLVQGMLEAETGTHVIDRPAALQYLSRPSSAEPPRRLGPFTILGELGRGGMGIVYEAQQEHPDRRVALKLVPAMFAGESVLRRFEHEAHVLGWLNHPGIAQIYEAGVAPTPTGPQPYFAMELVRGRSLTKYATETGLDLRARLALLERVCRAVHHAHQKGVVHRDLKPGNILVDESGTPKVLDFGIAHAIDADPESSFVTRTGDLLGTASYMSPEQMEADPAQLDTRSDVYSLGVLGYELVTGQLPLDLNGLPLAEALRRLREAEPDPPSRVIASLAGDVDTVLRKALAKEKSARYASAEALADDIARFLAYEPIAARPPSTLYQARKFARRHRTLVASAVAIFVVLVAATIFSVYAALNESRAAQRAEERRAEAERQSAIALAVNEFLNYDLLAAVRPDELGRDVTMREVLDAAAATVESRFEDQPVVGAEVRHTIADTYLALGYPDLAEPLFRRALELREEALGPAHESTMTSYNGMGRLMLDLGRTSEAEAYLRRCLELRREVLGPADEQTISSQINLAGVLRQQGRMEEALDMTVEADELAETALPADHAVRLSVLEALAAIYKDLRRMDESIPIYERLYETHQRIGSSDPVIARCANNLAVSYMVVGRLEAAETLFSEAVRINVRSLGEEHSRTIATLTNLARVTDAVGKHELAEERFVRALELSRRVNGDDHRGTLIAMSYFAEMQQAQGRFDAAESLLLEAHALSLERYGADFPVSRRTAEMLAGLYESTGRPQAAEEWRERSGGI